MQRAGRTKQLRTTVLFVTNGQKTEMQYLNLLKQAIHKKHGKKYSVRVSLVEGDPNKVLGKLTSPLGDASAYDQVWIFVDKDYFSLNKFLNDCTKEDKRRIKISKPQKRNKHSKSCPNIDQQFKAVVSNPCFEVWLVAYFEQVKRYQNQDEAKRHYERLAGLSKNTKELPGNIQIENLKRQSNNAKLTGRDHIKLNEEGMSPGTSIPNVLDFYELL